MIFYYFRCQQEQLKLQEGIQALSVKKKRHSDLQDEIRQTTTEKQQEESKLAPIQDQLTNALDNKERIRQSNRKILNDTQSKLNKMISIDEEIQNLTIKINNLAEKNIQGQIEEVKASLERYKNNQKEKEKEIEQLSKKIETLKEEIAQQELNERNLQDNLALMQIDIDRRQVQLKLNNLEKDIGNQELRTLEKEKNTLLKQMDDKNANRFEKMGQINELKVNYFRDHSTK